MSKKKRKILVIDDEKDMLDIVKNDLKEIDPDLEILTAQNGKDALKLLETNVFWGMITDIKMPDMSGIDFLEVTKKYRMLVETRVIVFSAYIPEELMGQCIKGGSIHTKPLPLNYLSTWLKAA